MTENQLSKLGHSHTRIINGKLCGLARFLFTTGLVVGLERDGFERRYCYEYEIEAFRALIAWDGEGHPPGPWIKCKGSLNGHPVDIANPAMEIAA